MINYLIAFVLTQIIESIIALILGFRDKYIFIAIFFINLITHPILNLFISVSYSYDLMPINIFTITILEIIVVLVEWWLLVYTFGENKMQLFVLALTMNATSYLTGLVIYPIQ